MREGRGGGGGSVRVSVRAFCFLASFSEITPEGRRITKLDQILLNGNNITMLVPGGEGPEV
ncbi:U6 snRNA-associated Sm-like protein LSm5 [Notamacropus eugenii]|uniref:U6 snRNA-associated Sm-like protein LSm5 n=1 Tax=Notamacropus eugenii TaxID=9315 RepID=UPI003B672B25